jgi:hypothetical protein
MRVAGTVTCAKREAALQWAASALATAALASDERVG